MTKKNTRPTVSSQERVIEKKWGKPLAATGWTALPNIILDKQKALGLKAMDVNILMQIAKYWWEAESQPFPSKDTIAAAIGVQPRTVQRHIANLEEAGLLKRNKRYYAKGGQKSNAYDFSGLINKATPFAEEALKLRQKKKVAERARLRRRQLSVVDGGRKE